MPRSRQRSCTALLLDSTDRYGFAGADTGVAGDVLTRLTQALRSVWPRQPLLLNRCVPGTDQGSTAPTAEDDAVSTSPYFTDAQRLGHLVPPRCDPIAVVRVGAALVPVQVLRQALAHAQRHRLDLVTVDGIPSAVFYIVSVRALHLAGAAGPLPRCVTVADAIPRLFATDAARRDAALSIARLGAAELAWDGQSLAAALTPHTWQSPPLHTVLALPSTSRLDAAVRSQQQAFEQVRAALHEARPALHHDGAVRVPVLVTVPSMFQSGANAAWEEIASDLSPAQAAFVVGRRTALGARLRARGFTCVDATAGLSPRSADDGATFLRALAALRPAIVHFDGAEGNTWAPVAFASGARIVQHVRLNDVARFQPAFEYADAVVTVSEHLRAEVANRVGRVVRVRHVPDGVRLDARWAAAPDARRRLGDHRDGPVRCLCLGRVEPEKGQLRVIEIVRALAAHASSRLLIVGSCGSDPAYCDAVTTEVLAGAAGLSSAWRTYTHPVSALYAEADVVLVGSRNEALGMVGLEALAAGCLLVARRSIGYSSIVDEARGEGLLFDDDEPASRVAARILVALADAPARAESATRKAAECFDARVTAARLSALWRELSGGV